MPVGTIQGYLKTLQMQQKWKMRREGLLFEQKQASVSSAAGRREPSSAEKAAKRNLLIAKLKTGKRLTAAEFSWMRENDETLYRQACRIERERVEHQKALRKCRSREEANRLHNGCVQEIASAAVSAIRKASGASERLAIAEFSQMHQAAVNDEYTRFQSSPAWGRLPEREEKRRRSSIHERVC